MGCDPFPKGDILLVRDKPSTYGFTSAVFPLYISTTAKTCTSGFMLPGIYELELNRLQPVHFLSAIPNQLCLSLIN